VPVADSDPVTGLVPAPASVSIPPPVVVVDVVAVPGGGAPVEAFFDSPHAVAASAANAAKRPRRTGGRMRRSVLRAP